MVRKFLDTLTISQVNELCRIAGIETTTVICGTIVQLEPVDLRNKLTYWLKNCMKAYNRKQS